MAAIERHEEFPLVVIVGPTASGKTNLAIELADEFGGEIICADSRTVYRGMDIGTAKPSLHDRQRVPHWGLDLVEPDKRFTAADFKEYADDKIENIRRRKKIPFLVGGTGLYVDGLLFDYQFGPGSEHRLRDELEGMSLEELHKYCSKYNIRLPNNSLNKRYIIRAIEQRGINDKREQRPKDNTIIVGIATNSQVLRTRIADRFEQILTNGVVEEAIVLGNRYGWESEAMTGNIYPLLRRYLENEITLEQVEDKFTTLDWRLAKRQLTWFRRNPYVLWLTLTEAREYLWSVLANE